MGLIDIDRHESLSIGIVQQDFVGTWRDNHLARVAW